jgi:hypothetical protein
MLMALCNAPIEPHLPRESSVVQTIPAPVFKRWFMLGP